MSVYYCDGELVNFSEGEITGDNSFVFGYGSVSVDEIKNALDDGKRCFCAFSAMQNSEAIPHLLTRSWNNNGNRVYSFEHHEGDYVVSAEVSSSGWSKIVKRHPSETANDEGADPGLIPYEDLQHLRQMWDDGFSDDNGKMSRYIVRLVQNGSTYTVQDYNTNQTLSFDQLKSAISDTSNYVVCVYGNSKLRPQYVSSGEMMFIGLDRASAEAKILRLIVTPSRVSYETFALAGKGDYYSKAEIDQKFAEGEGGTYNLDSDIATREVLNEDTIPASPIYGMLYNDDGVKRITFEALTSIDNSPTFYADGDHIVSDLINKRVINRYDIGYWVNNNIIPKVKYGSEIFYLDDYNSADASFTHTSPYDVKKIRVDWDGNMTIEKSRIPMIVNSEEYDTDFDDTSVYSTGYMKELFSQQSEEINDLRSKYSNVVEMLLELRELLENGEIDEAKNLLDSFILDEGVLE